MVTDQIVIWVLVFPVTYFLMCKGSTPGWRAFGWLVMLLNACVGMALLNELVMVLPASMVIIYSIIKISEELVE